VGAHAGAAGGARRRLRGRGGCGHRPAGRTGGLDARRCVRLAAVRPAFTAGGRFGAGSWAAAAVNLADLAEAQREQQAQRAVEDEAVRIARELHDVIAHGLSVIVVQAAAGSVLPRRQQSTREVLAAIERTGRQSSSSCVTC
jgi:signal transduction histidine kinase